MPKLNRQDNNKKTEIRINLLNVRSRFNTHLNITIGKVPKLGDNIKMSFKKVKYLDTIRKLEFKKILSNLSSGSNLRIQEKAFRKNS